ncbi:MAG: permease [Firmicutes bacterium]|nr:permease [Bacillota bacterium]
MTTTDWGLLIVMLAALATSWIKDRELTKKALVIGYKSFINVLPFFVVVFAAIGLFEVLISPQTIRDLLGGSRGVLAPVIAAVLGSIASGPPAAVFPIGRYLLDQHASVTAVATLLTAWVAVGTASLPAEIAYMGRRFALTRWAVTFVFSIIVGVIMGWLL